ncbi:hypothetical protein CS0771_54730 [Catellatospora sp. IY07-71]|uniref:acyl carrier protein n=1 Tax=Catellatospora sp. IY07-71 TaxID=2728827 RepID=UPI001BB3BBE3|nr:acyl carrier protein [Catellatospora sp. IY07-71]BCJ75929.1 hypothetical protein CS0771_54730 [Catellatospora sp. IY07-71]
MPHDTAAADVEQFLSRELVDLGVEDEAIRPEAKFDELDIDSLDVADLMTSLKKNYGVDIPRRDLIGMTLGQLVERVVAGETAAER